MGVIVRGEKLYLRFKNAGGVWKTIGTGLDDTPKNRTEAAGLLADAEREAGNASKSLPAILRNETVRTYAKTWIDERRALDLDWKNDRGRLETHVLPVLGDLPIASVRTRHIVDLFKRIRTNTERPVAQRTVYNIYSVVSAMFRDAKLVDLIEQTPCCLDERQLGPLKDKDPEWRATAVFTRDEAETLLSHEGIAQDRRLYYACMLLAGMRPGEIAALRVRHYDPKATPLGKLTVALAHNTRKNRTKDTKTGAVREVPVHPTLAAMLAEWLLSGYEAMTGHAPEPDDLLLPLPPEAAGRRRTREGEPIRSGDYAGKRWREEDLAMLGWRSRELYAMKSTFISLCEEDGADIEIIESRVTHTKVKRAAIAGYVRRSNAGLQNRWTETCREVAKLQLTRSRAVAAVAGIENGIARHSAVTTAASKRDNEGKSWRRRESNATDHARQDTACMASPTLTVVRGEHGVSPHDSHCDDSLQRDEVAIALDTARSGWVSNRDPSTLRRALLRLLADLD